MQKNLRKVSRIRIWGESLDLLSAVNYLQWGTVSLHTHKHLSGITSEGLKLKKIKKKLTISYRNISKRFLKHCVSAHYGKKKKKRLYK